MDRRFLGVVAFAAIVALAASGAIYGLLVKRLSTPARASRALIAVRDVAEGTLLRAEDVKAVEWKGDVPRQAIAAEKQAQGRPVAVRVRAGDLITEDKLAPEGTAAGLAAKIPAGKRAIAVRVNDVAALAGFVVPGSRVDVVACVSANAPGEDKRGRARTILQNVEVLSAGQKIERDNDGKPISAPVVNLLVDPSQAEVVSLAASETKIQLVLRNPGDAERIQTAGTNTSILFGSQPPAPRPRKPAPPAAAVLPMRPIEQPDGRGATASVELIRGSKRESVSVPASAGGGS